MQPQSLSRSLGVLRTRGGAGLQRLGAHRNFALPPRRARSPQVKGEVTPMRTVPSSIPAPPYAATGRVPSSHPPAEVHSAEGVSLMRVACREAADLLAFAGKLVVPGATGEDIDRAFHEEAVRRGVYPSPLNYAGFPKSLCVSINEVVCHGIPDSTELEEGDVVKLDVSVWVGGRHGDTCRTFVAGGPGAADAATRRLVDATKGALDRAVQACGPGLRISTVGDVIHPMLDAGGFDVVREYAGHGIGRDFHTRPIVLHHRNRSAEVLRPGMTFTIEPIVVEGRADICMWPDGWAIVTADRSWGAQFEHTLLVTDHGVEVLTAYE